MKVLAILLLLRVFFHVFMGKTSAKLEFLHSSVRTKKDKSEKKTILALKCIFLDQNRPNSKQNPVSIRMNNVHVKVWIF